MMIAKVRLPLRSLRCAYDINPQFSSTHRGDPRMDRAFERAPGPQWDHRCINISSATSAPPYIRLKGRATDFVPLPEGVKPATLSSRLQLAGQAPEKEAISTPTPCASGYMSGLDV